MNNAPLRIDFNIGSKRGESHRDRNSYVHSDEENEPDQEANFQDITEPSPIITPDLVTSPNALSNEKSKLDLSQTIKIELP